MATAKSTSSAAKPGAKRITRTTVEQAKLPEGKAQHDIFDTVVPGFGLRIGKRKRVYFVMTRQLKAGAWKLVRVTLGDTSELDLSSARQQAEQAIEKAKQGKDPTEVRSARQQALVERSRDTFASVRADFLKRYVGRQNKRPAPRTLKEMERALSSDVLQRWADRPIADIGERDILEALDVLLERSAQSMANRLLAYLRLLFKWAKSRRLVDRDPTLEISKPGAERSRDRVLELPELRAIWQAADPGELYGGIVRLLMLTGQRRLEIGAMRWDEINEDFALETDRNGQPTETCTALVLPGERTKNGRKHIVPLSAPALTILEARRAEQKAMGIKSPFVFATSGRPQDRDTREHGGLPFAQWSRSKRSLDSAADLGSPWRLHDLRRAMVTHSADKLRIAPHIIEATVNHVSGAKAGVAGVYNRAEYLPERRRALDAWADYLLRHVGEIEADNVVELVREVG